jgi:8-hydroxy-5-deazaflavin:NADPH oxidoreductase
MIGGTGALGVALARRWVKAGYSVIIGSRDPAKAREAAAALPMVDGGGKAHGAGYAEAAATADILILTVRFAHQAAVIDLIRPVLRGQLLIDATVPLMPDPALAQLPEAGSAAVAGQQRLGTAARVVSAFHNVPAKRLGEEGIIDCDVLVFGDEAADRETAIALVEAAGLRGLHGGRLANSAAAEALTSVLIAIQRHYRTQAAGIRITGLG